MLTADDPPNPLANFTGLTTPTAENHGSIEPLTRLPKLAINIASDCNLACSYCYANKGLYGTADSSLMAPDAVEHTIRRMAAQFQCIESVQFMGGEPSMNAAAVARAGEVFSSLVDAGELVGMPSFQLVTNAVRLTDRFLDTLPPISKLNSR